MNAIQQQSPFFFVLIAAGCALMAACNVIWYRAKFAVKKKGFRVGYFSRHFDDYPNLKKAIGAESDPSERARLESLLHQMKLIWLLYPLALAAMFAAVSISKS
jgi:hypothetical protein